MATKKQLANLAKARAARAANLKKESKPKKAATKRRAAPKRRASTVKRKSNPSYYGVMLETRSGTVYLSDWTIKGPQVEKSAGKALKLCRAGAEALKHAIYTMRPAGVTKVDAVIIGSEGKKN